MLMKD